MRRLAVPFLMTASMTAPAVAQPTPKQPLPQPPISRNPPAPKPDNVRPAVPNRMEVPGGYIQRDAHDNCRKFVHSKCPEGSKCNPPPPKWVECPPEILNWAKPNEKVVKRDDGACHVYYDVKCERGMTCNPPPPKRVRCPGDLPVLPPTAPKVPASQPTTLTPTPVPTK